MTVRQSIAVVLTVLGAVTAGACSEHLNGGAACPVLCPGQNLQVLDTTFRIDHSSPVYDTTIASFPQLGTEGTLLVAQIPNRADVRGMLRFDSLTSEYTPSGDTLPVAINVAHAPTLFIIVDRVNVRATRGSDQVQFQLYNVDTIADTNVTVLAGMFDRAHLIGVSAIQLASSLRDTTNAKVADTIPVLIDSSFFLQKIHGDRKLRIGVIPKILNFGTDAIRLTINETSAPFIRFYASTDSLKDTTFARITSNLRSSTPVTDSTLLSRLSHFPLVLQGALPDSGDQLNIGGMPARRVFLHFRLPPRIIDTSNVIRATLILTPRPQPLQIEGDTSVLYPWPVVSSNKVMTPAEAANVIVSNTTYSLDSVMAVPSSSAKVSLEFVNAVRNWQNISDTVNTRSLVLRILNEGGTTLESSFWSSNAPDTANRPHVRIQYVKRSNFALP
jgi:hypothetical protein